VAMQYEITDKAAIEFSRDFYDAVADGLPVDAAVTEARAAVSMDSMLEWGTPVLYMRSPDGRIFDLSAQASRPHPSRETEERQEEDSLSRYRGAIEAAWADGKLKANEVEWLKDLAKNQLGLESFTAAGVEREVMGETIEAIVERQEQGNIRFSEELGGLGKIKWAKVRGWYKQEGEAVKSGEPLVDIETNLFITYVEAEQDGVLESIAKAEGESVTLGEVVGTTSD
jgi:biotin carboxyl carrier protein